MGRQSRNQRQSRDRGNSPTSGASPSATGRNAAGGGTAEASPPAAPNSTMNQEISRKRTKRFGHN